MSKSPPDDPFGKTVLGQPASAALVEHDPFAKGNTVFGPITLETLGDLSATGAATILGAPSPEALSSHSLDKGLTQLGAMGPGHTQLDGPGATMPGGLPPPEAFAPPDAYPAGFTQLSHTDFGAVHAWEAAAAEIERELARAQALHVEGVRAGKAGMLPQADALLRESLDLHRRYRPPGDISIAHGCVSLGTLYFYGHRPDLAEPLYREAWSLHRHGLGDMHPETATRAVELARALALLGRAVEAHGFLRGAAEVFARTLGPMHPAALQTAEMMRLLYG